MVSEFWYFPITTVRNIFAGVFVFWQAILISEQMITDSGYGLNNRRLWIVTLFLFGSWLITIAAAGDALAVSKGWKPQSDPFRDRRDAAAAAAAASWRDCQPIQLQRYDTVVC